MLVYVILNVDVSVIMYILVWIHVHVCVMVVGMWPMLWRFFVAPQGVLLLVYRMGV